MLIKDILNINGAKLIKGNINDTLTNISKDTRTIKKGETYLGLKGEVYDGNLFYEQALMNGAKTCILSNILIDNNIINKYDCNIILVNDTLEFLLELARIKRNSLNIPIIAVTGSVGKTSTKNIISDILKTKYKVLKTSGNLNTNIGLALTLLSLKNEEIIVLEMGMSKFGEISELTNIAKPTVGVITNIGSSHIGNLGSRENILKAKLEILEGLNGPLIINNDNDLLHSWYQKNKEKYSIITYGIDEKSDYQASNLTYDMMGSHFNLDKENVNINVLGKHFIYNALVAFTIGDLFNIKHEDIIKSLQNLTLEDNRMQIIKRENYTIINDTYNASYDSVYYALDILGKFKDKKIAILGDILELGDFGEEIHRKIGKLIVNNNIDYLITVGSLANYINKEAITNGFNKNNSINFKTNKETIKHIKSLNLANSTILIKASHGMNFKEIVDNI